MKKAIALSPTKANFAPLFYSGDLNLGLNKAAEFGFDGVELNLRDSDELDQTQLLSILKELHLEVPSIGTGQSYFTDHLSLADPKDDVQEKVRSRMFSHVRLASRMNAMVVIGSVRGKLDAQSEKTRKVCEDVAVQATQAIARFAAGKGVSILVEPINRYETNFINSAADAIAFIDQVAEDNVGIVLDSFHMNIEEPSLVQALHQAGDLLWHVHFVDSNRYAPGMGHINFVEIIHTLQEIGYDRYLSAEIVPNPDDDTAAQRWMTSVRSFID